MAAPRVKALPRRRVALLAVVAALAVTVAGITVGADRENSDTATGSGGTTPPHATTKDGEPTGTGPTPTVPTSADRPAPASGVLLAGFSLKAGAATSQAGPTTPVVSGTPLPQSVLAQILGRLPAWSATAAPGTGFRWPAQSLTKPAAGKTVTQTFPAPADGQNPPTAPAKTPTGPCTCCGCSPRAACRSPRSSASPSTNRWSP